MERRSLLAAVAASSVQAGPIAPGHGEPRGESDSPAEEAVESLAGDVLRLKADYRAYTRWVHSEAHTAISSDREGNAIVAAAVRSNPVRGSEMVQRQYVQNLILNDLKGAAVASEKVGARGDQLTAESKLTADLQALHVPQVQADRFASAVDGLAQSESAFIARGQADLAATRADEQRYYSMEPPPTGPSATP